MWRSKVMNQGFVLCSDYHLCGEIAARTPLLHIYLDALFEEPTSKPESTYIEHNE